MTKHNTYIINVWTDGSYNAKTKEYGGAYYIEEYDKKGVVVRKDSFSKSQNVSGECIAVIEALRYINDNISDVATVVIHHDYTGLAAWAYGEWQAKSPIGNWYLSSLSAFSNMDIIFHKVQAHAGVQQNVLVDRLVAEALGVEGKN